MKKVRLFVAEAVLGGWYCEIIGLYPSYIGYGATRWEAIADWHNKATRFGHTSSY